MVLDPDTVATVCRRAETRATGVPVGMMDQLAAIRGRAGHALELDCRTLESTQVPIPADVAVLVLHSGEPRSLAASAYAARRAAGEELARRIGVASLRDATPDQVADDPVGRHVVSENARVLATAEALRRNDRDALADAFAVSHQSLRADYDVSTEALDFLVEGLARAGAIGARMTGGGFGGCVVALADADDARRIVDQALETARGAGYAPFEIPCTSADGASVVRLP